MKLFGLLGKNIDYSFSRGYFSEKFEKEQLPHSYHNFDIPNINELDTIVKKTNLCGFNVTIPYKQEIIPFLDKIDPIAQEIGAVNVVKVTKDKKLIGYNSDYYGFTDSLKPLLHSAVKKALILGTGGASKAIAYALTNLNITYSFVSRTPSSTDILSYEDLDDVVIKNHQLIINCTPLGTHPNIEKHPNIPYQYLTETHILYDLIYNPATTSFMQKGIDQGTKSTNGLQMLILQAEKSWEIWNY